MYNPRDNGIDPNSGSFWRERIEAAIGGQPLPNAPAIPTHHVCDAACNHHGIDPTRADFWRDEIEKDVVNARRKATEADADYEAHCMVQKLFGREPLSPEDYRASLADYNPALRR